VSSVAFRPFPDDVVIHGDRRAAQKQLGDAVPSLLAEVLARSISGQLLDVSVVGGRPRLLPPCRLPVPAPAAVERVPSTYRQLADRHAAHPGTGKGPRASLRRPPA
jgi:DNA (cytosine-5)-methyltransferase 1